MSEIYDVVIIGGGPGGITAGVKAAETGLSYVILEKGAQPGAFRQPLKPAGRESMPAGVQSGRPAWRSRPTVRSGNENMPT